MVEAPGFGDADLLRLVRGLPRLRRLVLALETGVTRDVLPQLADLRQHFEQLHIVGVEPVCSVAHWEDAAAPGWEGCDCDKLAKGDGIEWCLAEE